MHAPHRRTARNTLPGAAALLLAALATTAPLPAAAQADAPAASAASAPAGPTVRPEFGTPLQAAQDLIGAGKFAEALAKLNEAQAVPNRTPFETYVLERTRSVAALKAGDTKLMMKSLEAALATGEYPKDEELQVVEAMVGTAAREKDHPAVLRWSQRYIDLKGTNDTVRVLRIDSMAASGDTAGATAAWMQRLEAADRANTVLPENHLRQLLGLQQKAKDAGASRTLERLAMAYPRPEYWGDLVAINARDPNLGDRALLELYRLLRATGNLKAADVRDDMAQLALRVGQPGEAQVVVDEGFAAGVLGTGAQAAAHQKLREQARKQAATDKADRAAAEAAAKRAPDGTALADLGWSIVASAPADGGAGAIEPGLALIEQGVAKGGLKRASEARLHLGQAQLAAGRKDAAKQTLNALAGSATGAGEPLAVPIRLWSMYANAPAMLPTRNP